MPSSEDIGEEELVQRLIYAFLKPVARLAAHFEVPMKTVTDLTRMAYFQELRESGVILDDVADRLQISRRSAARLSARLRSRFAQPHASLELPARIELMVAAQPMSAKRITQVLRADRAEVDAAIQSLVDAGRLRLMKRRTPTYEVVGERQQSARDRWLRRVDTLTNLTENLGDVVYGRFFAKEPNAFARTLTVRVPSRGQGELEAMFDSKVYPTVEGLSDRADAESKSDQIQLSLYWAPVDLLRSKLARRG